MKDLKSETADFLFGRQSIVSPKIRRKPHGFLEILGATENNLKNIDVTIPRAKFVVISGLSGSGKSTLAFDTIYSEGQRKYVESLSAYARQFLQMMNKYIKMHKRFKTF